MIRIRAGLVTGVVAARPGAVELSVDVDGEAPASAIAYPDLTGPVGPGDRVVLNTTAVALGLGTGGLHVVMAVVGGPETETEGPGHTMKLRYTPGQTRVTSVEEPASPDRAAIEAVEDLAGTPVVWVPLHSMVGPVAAGARAAGASRVAYVWTDGAALPVGLSRVTARLRSAGVLDAVISCGQAFGGDREAVTTFTGLLAARAVAAADVVVVGDGPGNTGTGTTWGASDVESAMSLLAATVLGGRAVAALRMSFADPRPRHRGVSHHARTALSRVAPPGVVVAVPTLPPEQAAEISRGLQEAGIADRHRLVEADGRAAVDLLADRGIEVESMGRRFPDDPAFFLAAGAAGWVAGRMSAEG